ncbi:Kinesin-like protein KIF1C [Exophiala dermatitidis]
MYVSLRDRYCAVLDECIQLLDYTTDMVPPARTITTPSRTKTPTTSTASSPSLRSKTPVTVPMAPLNGNGNPGGNVKVVVRVRGFLPREIDRGAQCLIEMNPETQSTKLLPPPSTDPANARAQTRKVLEEKTFTFDRSFWSHNTEDSHYATQEDVYNSLGEEFLDHNFEGYHTCIFAYGQTGSGKSYTMMGTSEQPGLIPRTCEDLFERIESNESANISYSVRVSYFEVYNEHVRDLFQPRTDPPQYLKIRESPTEGPYVKDLTEIQVKNYTEILKYMRMGDSSRTTASTKMNDTSSRSHAVFTIMLKQIHHDYRTDETTERLARIRLVDLAGSERAKATEATGQRLREGGNINKSLTTLGRVIAALADPKHARMHNSKRTSRDIVPYRDSILTWLLKDSLGGNSKTAMIACIAPSDYDETLSTLRYADQAKNIRTKAIVNQDHVSSAEKDAQIAEMQETIRTLRWTLSQQQQNGSASVIKVVQENADAQSEKIREFTSKYENMLQIMEEKLAISESKVRQLEEEKEALSIHLKLVLEELKNPIVIDSREESVSASPQERSRSATPEMIYEDDTASGGDEVDTDSDCDDDAEEMQAEMESLISDLALFKKKLAADQETFGISVAA